MAWLQGEKQGRDENCQWETATFENSLFKAPGQITVTVPDPRTVPLITKPDVHQNTVEQRGKKSHLYTESTRGPTSISCADARTYMKKTTKGVCMLDMRKGICHM